MAAVTVRASGLVLGPKRAASFPRTHILANMGKVTPYVLEQHSFIWPSIPLTVWSSSLAPGPFPDAYPSSVANPSRPAARTDKPVHIPRISPVLRNVPWQCLAMQTSCFFPYSSL